MDEPFDLYRRQNARPSDDGWPREQLAVATLDEILHAERLRLEIRTLYERKAVPPPMYWSFGDE